MHIQLGPTHLIWPWYVNGVGHRSNDQQGRAWRNLCSTSRAGQRSVSNATGIKGPEYYNLWSLLVTLCPTSRTHSSIHRKHVQDQTGYSSDKASGHHRSRYQAFRARLAHPLASGLTRDTTGTPNPWGGTRRIRACLKPVVPVRPSSTACRIGFWLVSHILL